ncbi:hypothetical protein PR003_g34050 [Phytophthora rubi]|uniref:Uncharacterized protein n=1 Tax=Phytophthora rubi TaxID=129364 RepID=A0A6A4ANB5_9STRA|nr:hypothetical protein PR003_g34051 [Phytophthora rubi]KAE9261161.1 hypothetical protein PR003_g34050 [Phytophthora rubi]
MHARLTLPRPRQCCCCYCCCCWSWWRCGSGQLDFQAGLVARKTRQSVGSHK